MIEINELIQYIANCYFWIFLIVHILSFFVVLSDEFTVNKINAIENGTYYSFRHMTIDIIGWTLFFISIKLS
jgi:hypothetical protein